MTTCVWEIHQEIIQKLQTLGTPPYPAVYEKLFHSIVNESADKELLKILGNNLSLCEKVENTVNYLEIIQMALSSFTESNSEIVRIASIQQGHLEQSVPKSSECIVMVENLTLLGEELSIELKKADEKIKMVNHKLETAIKEATVDSLTQALNRKALYEDLNPVIEAGEDKQINLMILMLDIDNFKGINDCYGHITGDKVLQYLVKLMKTVVRTTDKVYRFGGEEFLIVLNRCQIDTALTIAEKIRSNIARSKLIANTDTIQLTVSIGVASHQQGDTLESIVERADEALYDAKGHGKNKVILHGV
jgi:diguanylate cyclase